jgi:hypothetical protein
MCLFILLAVISSAADLDSGPNYRVQNIENVEITLTIEGRLVALHVTKGTFGQVSNLVFEIVVNDVDEACQLAKLTNPDLQCFVESEHKQTNGFISRNSTAKQHDTNRYSPLSTTLTASRHALDPELETLREDVAAGAPQALEQEGSDKQKSKQGFTAAMPLEHTQVMGAKDKALLLAVPGLEKEEAGLDMVNRAPRKQLVQHMPKKKGMQPEDNTGGQGSKKQVCALKNGRGPVSRYGVCI